MIEFLHRRTLTLAICAQSYTHQPVCGTIVATIRGSADYEVKLEVSV